MYKIAPALVLYTLLFLPDPGEFTFLLETHTTAPINFSFNSTLLEIVTIYIPLLVLIFHPAVKMFLYGAEKIPVPRAHLNSAVRTAADAFFTLLGIAGIAAAVSCFSETLKIQGEESLFVVEDGAEIVVYIMLACGAAVEESFFRYFMINSFEAAGFSLWSASLVPVVLFTLPHIWEGIPGLLMAFLAGLFFTAVYERRRALLPLILAHAVYNMAAFSLSL